MHKSMFLTTTTALAFALGCGGAGVDNERLAQHIAESRVDCGDLEFGFASCPAGRDAALVCMEEALASCDRAKLIERFTTDEGAPIVDYLFVVPVADDGCGIDRFYDAREDGFGSMMLEEYSCSSIAWTEGNQCPFPHAANCQ